jgi:superkiller protein 3
MPGLGFALCAAILSAALAPSPCAVGGFPNAGQQTAALPDLPHPDLQSLIPTARAEIQKAYDSVLAHPQDASANGKLGELLHAYSLLADAEVCYRRAHLLDLDSFRWAYYLGTVQTVQAKCADAIQTLHEALLLKPDYFPARLGLGECLAVSREWEEAGKLYEALLQKQPGSAEAHYGLGRVREGRKDLAGAIECYRKACELFPKFGAAHLALARLYRRLGKRTEAQEEENLAQESGGAFPFTEDPVIAEVESLYRDFNGYLKLGAKLGGEGKWKDAADAYEEALNINPKLSDPHVRLIYLYMQLGQVTKAEEHFRAAVSLDPKSAEAYFNYGVLVLGQGRAREAEDAFRNALKINPNHTEAHNNLGYLLEGQGRLSEAVEELQKALESSPDFPQANFSLGRVLVKEGKFEEGIPRLLKAVAVADEATKSSYLYAVGIAYADLGDLENGLRYLRLARQKAMAEKQSSLLQRIDDDWRLLEGRVGEP